MTKYSHLSKLIRPQVYLPRKITSKRLEVVSLINNWKGFKTVEKHYIIINNTWPFESSNKYLHSDRNNIISKYFLWANRVLINISEMSEDDSTDTGSMSMFNPPVCTKGMKVLDKSAFKKQCQFLGLKVPVKCVSKLSKLFKSKLVKISRMKPIALLDDNDPDKATHKMFLFSPKHINSCDEFSEEERKSLSDSSIDYKKLEWFDVELGYDNWTSSEIIRAILPDNVRDTVAGFSTIGHIAHFNLKEEVLDYKYLIGQVILDHNSSIQTVVNKLNIIDNTFRNFKMELLAGKEDYITTAKENNCTYEFDFSKVYWNSRLGSEHQRLVNGLNNADVLYDVFAGVGPFSIPAAKKGVHVYANDLNPESFKSLMKNIVLNKIKANIKPYNIDGREFIKTIVKDDMINRLTEPTPIDGSKMHIAMNLPALALEFLDSFKSLIDKSEILDSISPDYIEQNLPTVHCYCFSKSEDVEKDVKDRAESVIGMKLPPDTVIRYVRNVAPNKEMMCLTFKLMTNLVFSETNEEPDAKRPRLSEQHGD